MFPDPAVAANQNFITLLFNKPGAMSRIMYSFIAILVLSLGCSRNPYAAANRLYKKQVRAVTRELRRQPAQHIMGAPFWVGTTNFNLRKPNIVVIHHTAQENCAQTLKTFTTVRTQVSAHYVICKDGTIHHMLHDYFRAWHGGSGRWGNITDVNSSSIGIEIDNNGFEPFSESQLSSLLILLDTLKKKYIIPAANFIGHADMAPARKSDPNAHFPWKRLSEKGFGIWYGDTTGVQVPKDFNALHGLRLIGYDTRDSAAVFAAFQRKYLQQEGTKELTDAGRKVLYSLLRQHQ